MPLSVAALNRRATDFFDPPTGSKISTVERVATTLDGVDKTLKLAAAYLDVAQNISSKIKGPDHKLTKGFAGVYKGAKTTRDFTSMFNPICAFRKTGNSMLKVIRLIKNFFSDAPVHLKRLKEVDDADPIEKERIYRMATKHNEIAIGRVEKALQIGSQIGKGGAGAAFMFAFSGQRYSSNLEKYAGVKLSAGASKFAKGFGYTMMANHALGLGGTVFDMFYQEVAVKRAFGEGGDVTKIYSDYSQSQFVNALNFFKNKFELGHDISKLFPSCVPLQLALGVVGATLSFASVIVKE